MDVRCGAVFVVALEVGLGAGGCVGVSYWVFGATIAHRLLAGKRSESVGESEHEDNFNRIQEFKGDKPQHHTTIQGL